MEPIDPTARLFKLATDRDNEQAREILNDSHKSIEYYYSLPPEQFSQLRPALQSALNNLKQLYQYESMARESLKLNIATISVEIFARRYYRWLRGESVPQSVLDQSKMTAQEYVNMLFNEWCANVGRATNPIRVIGENGEDIYLLPPLHCRDTIDIKEQVGYTIDGPAGETFVPSAGAINDNFNKINLLQTPDQKDFAMKKLFDKTISVNGTKRNGVQIWVDAWRDAIIYFDKAFGLEPLKEEGGEASPESGGKEKPAVKDIGYAGKLSDLF